MTTATPARYRDGTIANQAFRNALRQRAMWNLYGARPGEYGKLTDAQQANVDARQANRYDHFSTTNPDKISPMLGQLFQNNKRQLRKKQSSGGGGGSNTPPVTNNPTPTTPPVDPYIQINSNGQLDLPYNQQFSDRILDAQAGMNNRLLQLQQQSQQQDLEYGSTLRDAELDYNNLARSVLNQNAARGLAFSSAYGIDVADNARDYNNYLTDITQANALHDAGVTAERGNIETQFNEMVRRWALARAQDEAKKAGDLGYGKPGEDKPKPIGNRPRPKPNKSNNNNSPKTTWGGKHNRSDRIGPQGNLQKPKAKPPVGKRWVPIKGKKGKVYRWKLVSTKAGK